MAVLKIPINSPKDSIIQATMLQESDKEAPQVASVSRSRAKSGVYLRIRAVAKVDSITS